MNEHELRLGDIIDDYCPRCKLLLNHAVASMVSSQVAKVICQTCYSEHVFHHAQGGKKKTPPRTTLFDQVLGKVSTDAEPEPAPEPEVEEEKAAPPPKRKAGAAARYITRHKGKPARGKK